MKLEEIIIFIIFIVLNVVIGVILSSVYKKIYDKKNSIVWIPFINIYLIGKIAFDGLVGFILFVGTFIIGVSYISVNGRRLPFALPELLRNYFSPLIGIWVLACFIVILLKLLRINKRKKLINASVVENNISQQEVSEAETFVFPTLDLDDTNKENM